MFQKTLLSALFAGVAFILAAAPDGQSVKLLRPGDMLNAKKDRGGWKSGYAFHNVSAETAKELKSAGKQYFKCTLGETLVLETIPGIAEMPKIKEEKITYHQAVSRLVKIPGTGDYVLKFQYRGNTEKKPQSLIQCTVTVLNKGGKEFTPRVRFTEKMKAADQFTDKTIAVIVPEGGAVVRIAFFVYGLGRLEIKNPELNKL